MLLKSFRYLLWPISFLYSVVIWIRNWMYDKDILKSSSFNFPLICVGNLAVGGTGKTPMTELLVENLQQHYKVATLSRGYKRKTTGFAIADEHTTALEIGDEPMQFHKKYEDLIVAVGEERVVAIPQLLHQHPETQVIILDDAFQHRTVKAGLNIVLTECRNLYTRDFMMPAGDLRDVKQSMKRAHIIVVTKCRPDFSVSEKEQVIKEINPLPHQRVFFTSIVYGQPYHLFQDTHTVVDMHTDVLLLCGIANPKPLKEFMNRNAKSYDLLRYADHHIFTSEDLDDIRKEFADMPGTHKIIITTEKDAVRLHKFEKELKDFPIYALAIQHWFLFSEQAAFMQMVNDFVEKAKNQPAPPAI